MPALLTDVFKNVETDNKSAKKTISHEEFFQHFDSCEQCRSKIFKLLKDQDKVEQKLNLIIENQEKILNQRGGGSNITQLFYDFVQENPLVALLIAILLIQSLKK